MKIVELRDLDEARLCLVQSLWLQRMVRPGTENVAPALQWALEAVSSAHRLPPVGFVADLGYSLLYALAGPEPKLDLETERRAMEEALGGWAAVAESLLRSWL